MTQTQPWTITLPSGNAYAMSQMKLAHYSVAAELLDGADWTNIHPTQGPRQLAVWVAILMAQESENKDVQAHLEDVMNQPITTVLGMLTVE